MASVFLLLAPSVATAAITFKYVTDAASYSAAAGQAVNVKVFLQETDTNGNTIFGDSRVTGLQSFGIFIHQTSPTGTSTISSFSPAGQLNNFGGTQSFPVPGASGTGGSSTSSTSASMPANSMDYANAVSQTTTSNPVTLVSGTAGNGVFQIQVGTLSVIAGNSTTFTLTSMSNSPGDNANAGSPITNTLPFGNGNSYSLDLSQTGAQGAAGPQTFTGAGDALTMSTFIVAVPEPSSILLCAMAGIGAAVTANRRRKAKAALAA
jgi:hypothetical protein